MKLPTLIPTTKQAYEFFHRGTLAFSQMEARGIKIDVDYLEATMTDVGNQIKQLEREFKGSKIWKQWQRRFGDKANVQSVPQLGTLLKSIGYKSIEKTDTGKDKWDERAVERIGLPELNTYILMKKLKKANGTYLKGIHRELDSDGFLHPSYNLAGGLEDDQKGGAMSYRGSSSNPNFTNIPIRNKTIGKLIRKAVVGYGDFEIGEIDHSTIEVRVAGMVTRDKRLMNYVKNSPPLDMHRDRAMELFFLKEDQVVKKGTRDAAKNKFVFPQFYGSFYVDCAEAIWEAMERGEYKVGKLDENGNVVDSDVLIKDHLKKHGVTKRGLCDEEQAPKKGTFEYHVKTVEDKMWNEVFKEYTAWKKASYNKYLKTGEVQLPTGFIARGPYRRNQVLNLPIQGPAFHILLWGIIELQAELKRLKMKSYIFGQIHDCILCYIHKKERQQFLNMAKEIMTQKIRKHWSWINLPLEIEVDIVPSGLSWNEKQPWHQTKEGLWVSKA